MARTILYARTSTDDQANGMAVQVAQVEGAAERERWPNPVVVKDEGVSGKTPAIERPNLGPELARIEEGDRLVVAKLDRLSRSMLDFANLLDLSGGEGWTLTVLDLGIDTATPQGKLIAHMVVALAQWEREMIGIRVSEGMARSPKVAGRAPGLPAIGGGRLAPITPELRDAVETLRPGRSPNEIAKRLNAQGQTSPRGKRWHRTSVRRLIERMEREGLAAA
jgi:DNA invertase Pin-like site-specific DNA recombinase